jgi:TetR/AcrR family transcriptional repressor of nem operon
VNRALVLFWRKGYQATSLEDLLKGMGIGRSSFYAAFGDKRTLFIECVDLFGVRTLDIVRRDRGQMPPLDALQEFFERSFTDAQGVGSKANWGCMLVNTVIEMADVDEDLVSHASRYLSDMQLLFKDCLQEAGASPARAEELAAMLMVFNEGIRVSSRRRLPQAQYLQPVATTFQLIRSVTA